MIQSGKIIDLISNTFELSPNRNNSIKPMEGLRGLAVLLVFFVHYAILFEPSLDQNTLTFKIAKNLWNIGRSGVDLFFILSGFLIYGHLIEKEYNPLNFFKRRAVRIYPAFLAVFVLYLLLSFALPDKNRIPANYTDAAIYLLQNLLFIPGLFEIEPIISVAWSLSYEVFFYLLIPLIIWLFALKRFSPERRIAFFAAISIIGFTYYWFYDGHIRLLMFVSGIILYDFLKLDFARQIGAVGFPALITATAAMIYVFESGISMWFHYVSLFCLFFLLCLDCFANSGLSAKIFSFTPLRWFGNISYSYYLIHGIAINGLILLLKKAGFILDAFSFWSLLIPVFIMTLIPSIVFFVLLEKPFSLGSIKKTETPF